MSESELIAGCRRRDRKAQRAVYDRHAERIFRLALRLTRNEQDAFDIAQETFVQAFERIGSFDERSQLGTWLYRIATNEALQLFRRQGTEQRHLQVLAERTASDRCDVLDSAFPDVDDALARLSEPHRVILILKYQEGLSYEEIAGVLEIAPGTVASRMNRARAELRAMLSGEPGTREEAAPTPHPKDETSGSGDVGSATAG